MLYLLVLCISAFIGSSYGMLCAATASCKVDPHRGSTYIGFTNENCKGDHIYVCKDFDNHYCYGYEMAGPKSKYKMCRFYGEKYSNCYNSNGDKTSVYANTSGFLNPFEYSKHCGKLTKVYANGGSDKNCYYSAYGNKVSYKNASARYINTPRKINGRCLDGKGWCPC